MNTSNLDPVLLDEWKETRTPEGPTDGPYLYERVSYVTVKWNKNYVQDALCMCDHPYYRHFDTYEEMRAVGCKYCGCMDFVLKE